MAHKPSKDDVQDVMDRTGCDANLARRLLRRCKDPNEAVENFEQNRSVYDQLAIKIPPNTSEPSDSSSVGVSGKSHTPATPISDPQAEQDEPEETQSKDDDDDGNDGDDGQQGDWSFILPRLIPTESLVPGGVDGRQPFDLPSILGAVQNGHSSSNILAYLECYDNNDRKDTIAKAMNMEVEGIPAMFYIAERNDDQLLRQWVKRGGDISATLTWNKVPIPLIGFVIIQAKRLSLDTSLILTTLLSLGASADVVPRAFFAKATQDRPSSGPDEKELTDLTDENKKWCLSPDVRSLLTGTLHLTMRYYLERSVKIKPPSTRHRQVATLRKAEALLGIHYFLIGQTHAVNMLMKKLLAHMITPTKRPLVQVFAGPSGHGKTELARMLGKLLTLEVEIVDCTIYNEEKELFGPRAPYVGSERGSPLNNFLARHDGKPAIVFLDEFEKTSAKIHEALLLPFGNGEYQDRRSLNNVHCDKIIWILATNALDETISGFCEDHGDLLFRDDKVDEAGRLVKGLTSKLKTEFMEKFKPPLTGRISAFLPFLNFSPDEQAVIGHKYIIELAKDVSKPVCMGPGRDLENLLGNINLEARHDGSVCVGIAKESYDRSLGARSLINGVDVMVKEPLVEQYLDEYEEIAEGQEDITLRVDVVRGQVELRRVHENGAGDIGCQDSEENESEEWAVESEDELLE